MGFPSGSEVKASASNAGDRGSIPGSGRSPGEGNGNPLQYSCLENPMDGGTWYATVHGIGESDTTEQLHSSLYDYTVKESEAAQLCLALHNPMDCSLPGSSVHWIFQARVQEWGAIAFSDECNCVVLMCFKFK